MLLSVDVHADLSPVGVVEVCLEALEGVDGLGVPSVAVVSLYGDTHSVHCFHFLWCLV